MELTSLYPQTIAIVFGNKAWQVESFHIPPHTRAGSELKVCCLGLRGRWLERPEGGWGVWRHGGFAAGLIELEWMGRWAWCRNHGGKQFILSGNWPAIRETMGSGGGVKGECYDPWSSAESLRRMLHPSQCGRLRCLLPWSTGSRSCWDSNSEPKCRLPQPSFWHPPHASHTQHLKRRNCHREVNAGPMHTYQKIF